MPYLYGIWLPIKAFTSMTVYTHLIDIKPWTSNYTLEGYVDIITNRWPKLSSSDVNLYQ